MKKIVLVTLLISAFAVGGFARGKKPVAFENVPEAVQEEVQKYFMPLEIQLVTVKKVAPRKFEYTFTMEEGTQLKYSNKAQLLDVENEKGITLEDFLKETNDTLGHSAGDKLIRKAAECITSCFGDKSFRIGGDEFAAVVEDCKPEMVQQMIYRFREAEQRENVSISVGYAYAENISETTIKELLDEADRRMYAEKQVAHLKVQ